jgi:hypothetical protein
MFASGVYDPMGDRLLVVGGFPSAGLAHIADDSWAFAFDGGPWSELNVATDPHPGWSASAAAYDSRRGRLLAFQDDIVWAFESGMPRRPHRAHSEAASEAGAEPSATKFALGWPRPNPSMADAEVTFALPDATPATLELLDIAGRRVWVRDVGALGAGVHSVRISPGRSLAPGVYLLRLDRANATLVTKLVRLRR